MATPKHAIEKDSSGIQWFRTTAGARRSMDEAPENPLEDQVNPAGEDPEETDSDRDTEDEEEEGEAATTSQSKPLAKRTYNDALSSAINVEARLPPSDIGAVELLTFFPNHTQWPEAGLRLHRNGWKVEEIAKVQLHARGALNRNTLYSRRGALRHQVTTNGKFFFAVRDFKQKTHAHLMTPVTSYDASNYTPRPNMSPGLTTETLVGIAAGVINWPVGEDRGIVTQAIDYAVQNNQTQLTTADIPHIAHQQGFVLPNNATTDRWDSSSILTARNISVN